MADRYWLGTTDAVYSTAANWSATSGGAPGGVKPGAGDDVYFDGAGDNPCTLDEATAAVNSLSVHSAGDPGGIYSATLDFNDFAVNVTVGGDMTFDGSGTIDCGASTITGSGNFDYKDQATWTGGSSTVVMNGTGKTITGHGSRQLWNMTIDGSITVVAATEFGIRVNNDLVINVGKSLTIDDTFTVSSGDVTVNGTLSINSGKTFRQTTGVLTIGASGVVNGDGTNSFQAITIVQGGTFAPALVYAERVMILGAGTYGGDWTCELNSGSQTFTFGGNVVFTGSVSLDADIAGVYTIDLATNNVDVTFQGDVTLIESVGTITWSKGIGGILFSGASNQDVDFAGKAVEDWTINKSAGDFVLTGAVQTDSFTGTSTGTGDFDPNGQTITIDGNCSWAAAFLFDAAADCFNGCSWVIDGNFTADGQTLAATAGWSLEVAGTAVASGIGDVAECDANGAHTEINASAGPWTDSGNNTNWNFGIVEGSVCWGHVTDVLEPNVETFAGNWAGTGAIEDAGDAEVLALNAGENMVSEVVDTDALAVQLLQNEYDPTGDDVTMEYRHGATAAACQVAGWNAYVDPFVSLGFVQVRMTSTL